MASLTEHYFQARASLITVGLNDFKGKVRQESWAVGMVADVANATKHVVSHRCKLGYKDVSTHQLNELGIMRLGWPMGGREVLVGPDRAWRLSTLLEYAMEFWRDKLGQKG